jgi:hypothetical protein
MVNGNMDMVERINFFIDFKLKAYIIDVDNNYYFAEGISQSNTHIYFYNFDGKRKDTLSEILIINVKKIDEYKEKAV